MIMNRKFNKKDTMRFHELQVLNILTMHTNAIVEYERQET